MVDRLHFPLKSIMCAPVSYLDSMYVDLLVMYIDLSMYAIICVNSMCNEDLQPTVMLNKVCAPVSCLVAQYMSIKNCLKYYV
jgi:hypothetical protein